MVNHTGTTQLQYVSSDRVEVSVAPSTLEVRDREDRTIGQFDGVLIDPIARRIRFLIVDRTGFFTHQRYALPIDPTQLDEEHCALRVDLDRDEIGRDARFDPREFPEFRA